MLGEAMGATVGFGVGSGGSFTRLWLLCHPRALGQPHQAWRQGQLSVVRRCAVLNIRTSVLNQC